MCTMIVEKAEIAGAGRGQQGWFRLSQANVAFDHPDHMDGAHAVNIDFVNPGKGIGARIAVELSPESARKLAETILTTLDRGHASIGPL
jgi:hypothetical protein